MREIALITGGLIVGGLVGVTWMCLLQVNKDRHYIIQRKDESTDEKEKYSEDC